MSFSASLEDLISRSNDLLLGAAPHWPRVPLARVCRIVNGFPFKSEYFHESEGLPLLRIRDVTSGRAETFYRGPVPDGYWVRSGELVVGMDGDFNTRVWSHEAALLNQRVCKLIPDETALLKSFLAYILPGYLRLINQETHSITVKHLSSKTIGQIPLPLPALSEQQRIVAKIDLLSKRSGIARAEVSRVTKLVERYKQAVLAAAFRGELTAEWRKINPSLLGPARDGRAGAGRSRRRRTISAEAPFDPPFNVPQGWHWMPLPALGTLDRGRSRHRPRNAPHLFGGPYPFIQTGDVRAARGRLKSFVQTYSEEGLAQSRLWHRGTLCITIAANIAETAILDIDACFPDSVVGFSADAELCRAEFIELFIRTVKDNLREFAPATAQKNINLDTLENLYIPCPPLSEQHEVWTLVQNAFELPPIDKSKECERFSS